MPFNTRQYDIGTRQPGALNFELTLMFAPDQEVIGRGILTQAINPPLMLHTSLVGRSTGLWNSGDIAEIIHLTGYSEPLYEPLGFVNVRSTLVFPQSTPGRGTAQLAYRKSLADPWTLLDELPVTTLEAVAA